MELERLRRVLELMTGDWIILWAGLHHFLLLSASSLHRKTFLFPAEGVVSAQVAGWTPVGPVKPRAAPALFPSTWSVPFTFPFLSCSTPGDIAHFLGCFVLWKFECSCILESKEVWAHHSYIKSVFSSPLPRHSPCGHSSHISLLLSTQWNSHESFVPLQWPYTLYWDVIKKITNKYLFEHI